MQGNLYTWGRFCISQGFGFVYKLMVDPGQCNTSNITLK